MRRTIPLDETLFRGPGDPKEGRMAMKITLKREEYKEDNGHGWLIAE